MFHKVFIEILIDAQDRDTALSAVNYWSDCIQYDNCHDKGSGYPEGIVEFRVLTDDHIDHSVFFRTEERDDG